MFWRAIIAVLLVLATPCRASLLGGDVPAGRLCRPAVLAAERAFAIPDHLLAGIAHVESGRRDPVSGAFEPWPWTVNAEGQGSFYNTKAEAVVAVQTMQRQGVRSIDVGCMQISLLHHPDAFASLEQAFDPSSNAMYGARFLSELHGKTAAWPRAVEMYHSATPELGAEYGRLVYAALPTEQRLSGPGLMDNLSSAWAATLNHGSVTAAFPPTPMRIIPLGGGAFGGGGATAQGGLGAGGMGRSLDAYRMAPVRMAMRTP
jgi:Transglycosylase SLT domain